MIIARVPSGIPGLDALLQGGFPTNSTLALRAEPSNPAEYFEQQFIAEGLKHGFPAVYCCLSRPAASVIRSLKHQGFDVLEQVANDQLVFLDCYSMHKRTSTMGVDQAIQNKIISVTEVDDERALQDGLASAVERIPNLKGLRAVCESVPGTLTTKSAVEIMRWGRKAFGDLRAFETLTLHTFPVGIREELFGIMAHDFDGIIEIREERGVERVRYYLNIQKMRRTDVPHKMYELDTENALLSLKSIEKIT
ncbi:MAG: RAD55 family ATPase [Euryarchaeota archaeon]|jgi:KaiC/GvpD/RAD55 family RecA-like ATPase|nr:RAD55 family ATPase [Euryarchaeota archaeon]